ncbi:hypothetical protein [Endozoicomonas sp.]
MAIYDHEFMAITEFMVIGKGYMVANPDQKIAARVNKEKVAMKKSI